MSAANSSSGDREGDTLRRAQRAHEPSMEEILASIRNMMVDEREADNAASSRAASSRPPPPAPQIVYSKDDSGSQSPVQETPKLSPGGKSAPARLLAETREAKGDRPQPERADLDPEDFPSGDDDEPLLSPEASHTVNSAFEALSANLAARGAEIAEGMAREMLRPMLKAWLDENLPGIVERLVRAEIERAARGMR
ncbi:MAG TPA: DUF2497 domain-containing protein [Roseiarcus sp.]|jgi:hypothetical protein|nr:DUF2497 domain-containing protein [Roseiarcus sp.]